MSKTDYLENKILDHTQGKTSFTMPANVWIALFTAAPSDAGGGTEVTGGSYVRKQTTGADWVAGASGSQANATLLSFVAATADWGTATHFAIMDASSAGNMLRWAALTSPQAIPSGATASFAIGALVITED